MASYTMELREIIEQVTQYEEGLSINERIERGREKLFNFDYPIFSENYRTQFETNIIRAFYMREIGFETEGRFKFELESWLVLHMPYYNKLFESELIDFDPLESYSLETKSKRELDRGIDENNKNTIQNTTDSTGNDHTTGVQSSDVTGNQTRTDSENTKIKDNTDSFNRNISADTPENRLQLTSNADGSGTIEYASNITESKDTVKNINDTDRKTDGKTTDTQKTKTDSESESNTRTNTKSDMLGNETKNQTTDEDEVFTETKRGSIGVKTYSEMILEYRETFIRIEQMIHDELQTLFMMVY